MDSFNLEGDKVGGDFLFAFGTLSLIIIYNVFRILKLWMAIMNELFVVLKSLHFYPDIFKYFSKK